MANSMVNYILVVATSTQTKMKKRASLTEPKMSLSLAGRRRDLDF